MVATKENSADWIWRGIKPIKFKILIFGDVSHYSSENLEVKPYITVTIDENYCYVK